MMFLVIFTPALYAIPIHMSIEESIREPEAGTQKLEKRCHGEEPWIQYLAFRSRKVGARIQNNPAAGGSFLLPSGF